MHLGVVRFGIALLYLKIFKLHGRIAKFFRNHFLKKNITDVSDLLRVSNLKKFSDVQRN